MRGFRDVPSSSNIAEDRVENYASKNIIKPILDLAEAGIVDIDVDLGGMGADWDI